jgi:hypothetical protein
MIRALAAAAVLVGLLAACTQAPPVLVAAPAGHWLSLLHGNTLDDWTVKIAGHDLNDNYRNTFRMENGWLKVSYDQYDKFGGRFGSIFYNKKLSHYWFRAEYRFVGKQASGAPSWAYENSGIQLHSQAPDTMRKDQEFPVSVEFDIVGRRLFGGHPTGDVCENGTRVKIGGAVLTAKCSKLSNVAIPGDQWVTILAEVRGGPASDRSSTANWSSSIRIYRWTGRIPMRSACSAPAATRFSRPATYPSKPTVIPSSFAASRFCRSTDPC